MRRRLPSAAALLYALVVCAAAEAQTPGEKRPGFEKLGGPAGIQRYIPGAWGIVGAELVNPTDHPVDLLATTYFDEESQRQYARQIWVPAGARRSTWYPVLPPKSLLDTSQTVELKSLLFERTGSEDVLLKPPSGQVLYSERALLDSSRTVTGYMPPLAEAAAPRAPSNDDVLPDLPFEATVALRISARLSRLVVNLRPGPLPATVESYGGLNQLVLANDRIADDPAALSAVRRWLHQGGRLWIQLDRVSPDTVTRLLGDAFACHSVDRVTLSEFEIRETPPAAPNPLARQLVTPVDFVRVMPSGVEVVHDVNGWPASFWLAYGRGAVLFTTLAAEGWIRPRTDQDPRPASAESNSLFVATEPFATLAVRFFAPTTEPPLPADTLTAVVTEQVGYRVVGRGVVLAVLGIFCLSLTAAGFWLLRREKAERLGWLGPAGAVITSGVLMGLGVAARQAVPPTVAQFQLVDASRGVGEAQVSGLMAIYNQTPQSISVGANRGGLILPDRQGLGEETLRMVWTDLDQWHWEGLNLQAGVSSMRVDAVVPFDEPFRVRGTFGPAGFEGRVTPVPPEGFSDALVATNLGRRMSVAVDNGGKFTARPDQVLTAGQLIASTFLSDEQQRRMAIYRDLLRSAQYSSFATAPVFLGWSNPLNAGFSVPEGMRQIGGALVSVPIVLDRPAPETAVAIPSPFVSIRDVDGPSRYAGSRQSYNYRDGTWAERPTAARTWLRFQLPGAVLPVKLARAKLSIQLSAPGRVLHVEGLAGGEELVSLASRDNPIGSFEFEIDRDDVLQVDDRGGVTLGLNVADATPGASDPRRNAGAENFWKIEYVALDLYGETLAP